MRLALQPLPGAGYPSHRPFLSLEELHRARARLCLFPAFFCGRFFVGGFREGMPQAPIEYIEICRIDSSLRLLQEKSGSILCALCVQVSAITFHLNLIFFLRFCLFKPAFCSFASHFFSFSFFISLPPHTTTHTNTTHPHKKNTHTIATHTIHPTHHKKSIFSSQLFLLRVKKNTTGACKQLVCAKNFRGACAYDKFPGRSDDAMCGGLEIGEALLVHFLCGSKGAFFSVLQFLFFFGGVVSGIFRLKKRFLFYKNSLSSHPVTRLFFARGIAG